VFDLATAPAGTRVVSSKGSKFLPDIGILPGRFIHDIRRWTALAQFPRHKPHVRVDMGKEIAVTFAEIVEPRLTVGGMADTVPWAPAVAGKPDRALPAVFR